MRNYQTETKVIWCAFLIQQRDNIYNNKYNKDLPSPLEALHILLSKRRIRLLRIPSMGSTLSPIIDDSFKVASRSKELKLLIETQWTASSKQNLTLKETDPNISFKCKKKALALATAILKYYSISKENAHQYLIKVLIIKNIAGLLLNILEKGLSDTFLIDNEYSSKVFKAGFKEDQDSPCNVNKDNAEKAIRF